jgi:hypothetical protein
VLDADVLLRSSARDLFLYLAALGAIEPIWSDAILAEVARNFPGGADRFQRLATALDATFPGARKADFEHRIPALIRTHPKDRHVLALAAEYESDLVSFNHRDFDNEEARHHGVRVWAPDDAMARMIEAEPYEVRRAVERAWLMLRQPAIAWTEYVEHIQRDGFPTVAAWAGGLPEPQRTA